MATEFDNPIQQNMEAMLALRPMADSHGAERAPQLVDRADAPGDAWHNPETLAEPLENLLNILPSSCQAELEANLDRLQEQVLDRIYELFRPAGVDLSERLVIAVNTRGETVVGEHKQGAIISEILAENPDIARDMRTMGSLSLAIRGMTSLNQARDIMRETMIGEDALFQACFKGGLSHFHLI